jgi:RimJ/RimL family protein N-acetyltransferase
MAGNDAANAVARKAGLVHEATLRHHYANKAHANLWSMTAHEWRKSRWFMADEMKEAA